MNSLQSKQIRDCRFFKPYEPESVQILKPFIFFHDCHLINLNVCRLCWAVNLYLPTHPSDIMILCAVLSDKYKINTLIPHNFDNGLYLIIFRFYTVIPHNFGRQRPPVISDLETIRKKMDMLLVNIYFFEGRFLTCLTKKI